MSRIGYFKAEEIGTSELGSEIFFKGKKRSLRREQELVRYMPLWSKECREAIISLLEGIVRGDAEFARNFFQLAEDGIKELRIYKKGKKGGEPVYITSDLTFLSGSSLSRVLPGDALKYLLACKGSGNGKRSIYCHENLLQSAETLYNEERREEAIKRNKAMKKYFVFFKKIDDIIIEEVMPEVHINKDEYAELDLNRILMNLYMPDTVVYERDSKEYYVLFPVNRVTLEKALREHTRFESVHVDDPYNPGWQLDSMTIIEHVVERAGIEVDSIFIEGALRRYKSGRALRFYPQGAAIVFEHNGKQLTTHAPWEKAISLSYLHSKNIWIKDPARSYVI